MKKMTSKLLAVVLSAALLVGAAGITVYALNANDKSETEKPKEAVAETAVPEEAPELVKDETVYVIAGADGSIDKIIVSDWIKNAIASAEITDSSELAEVENVKGDETYTINGDGMRVWDAQGNDIYYQGNIEKELPVDIAVSYTLDGAAIAPDELAGKSGKLTIRYDYTNNQYETVEIDGKQEKMYVPFAMLTGMLLDNDVFSNVEVSNGKLINDGDRTAVVGIAFPGLQSNLNIAPDKLELPEYVEITADVENFEMSNTMTIATSELFTGLNTGDLGSLNELTDSLNELTAAMDQLMNGSNELYGGLCTLLEKSNELAAGIDQLAAGAWQLKAGAGNLDSGAQQLEAGAANLSNGLAALTANNEALNGGAKQVFDTLLATANAQLNAAGVAAPQLTIENYQTVLGGVIANVQSAGADATALLTLKAQLDSFNSFYAGLTQYTAGVASAKTGADTLSAGASGLKSGAETLNAGISNLYNGILTLKNGAPALVSGVTALRDGAMQLSGGLKEFNEQGVQKLVDAVDGDLGGLVTRLEATVDVAKAYRSFSGISEDMAGQVKFIYRTEAIDAK